MSKCDALIFLMRYRNTHFWAPFFCKYDLETPFYLTLLLFSCCVEGLLIGLVFAVLAQVSEYLTSQWREPVNSYYNFNPPPLPPKYLSPRSNPIDWTAISHSPSSGSPVVLPFYYLLLALCPIKKPFEWNHDSARLWFAFWEFNRIYFDFHVT